MRSQRPLLLAPATAALLTLPVLAQDKPASGFDWKELTKSGLPIKFYGFLRLDAYYNTARANSVILP